MLVECGSFCQGVTEVWLSALRAKREAKQRSMFQPIAQKRAEHLRLKPGRSSRRILLFPF